MSLPTVVAVAPGSPAEAAGLAVGDVVAAINGLVPRDVIEWRFAADEAEGVQAEEAATGLAKVRVQEAEAAAIEKVGLAKAKVSVEQAQADAVGTEQKGLAEVKVREDLSLPPRSYKISLFGTAVAQHEVSLSEVMIITNKVLLPILLSYMRFSASTAQKLGGKETAGKGLWTALAPLASRKGGLIPIAGSIVLTIFGLYHYQFLQIGDQGKGVPELWPKSRYNQDVERITTDFDLGVDLLQVIVEAQGDDAPCVNRSVQDKMEAFEYEMRQQDGVIAVRGLSNFVKSVTQDFAEGWVKWRMLPETVPQIAQGVGFATRLGTEYRNPACNAIPISIYTSDHQAATISRIVAAIKDFKAENDDDEVVFRLASGNVGVMAATNEVVHAADKWVNFTLFASVGLLCLVTFRSFRVTLCIIIPLGIVTLLCNATMAILDIGMKVNTLPVIAIAVGVGVDYGIYLFERVKHEMEDASMTLQEAFKKALVQRGTASTFTAVTMTISVATWTFSTLKFQADMGILLSFMFMVNLFGAVLLMPALAAYIVGDDHYAKKKK